MLAYLETFDSSSGTQEIARVDPVVKADHRKGAVYRPTNGLVININKIYKILPKTERMQLVMRLFKTEIRSIIRNIFKNFK